MTGRFHALIDSDAFVGRFYPDDHHHASAQRTFARYEQDQVSLVTTSLVVVEVATVLSHRSGQRQAQMFLDVIERSGMPIVHIDEKLQDEALQIFKAQTVRGTSVADCANVAVIHLLHIPEIFSYDRVYPKHFGLTLAG